MGGVLKFPIDDTLKSIVEHAAATDPGPYYGEKIERSLFLVKDQGVYLMSAGSPRQMAPDSTEEKPKCVVYAEGHNPDVEDFDDWWELGREVCGGDDFGEPIGVQFFRSAIALGRDRDPHHHVRGTDEAGDVLMEHVPFTFVRTKPQWGFWRTVAELSFWVLLFAFAIYL